MHLADNRVGRIKTQTRISGKDLSMRHVKRGEPRPAACQRHRGELVTADAGSLVELDGHLVAFDLVGELHQELVLVEPQAGLPVAGEIEASVGVATLSTSMVSFDFAIWTCIRPAVVIRA